MLEGRTECYRILVDRYRSYLYQVVYAIVRSPVDAEDVTQEAFLKIYSALPLYRKQGFKTWITRIATNKAIDHVRKLRRRKEDTVDQVEHNVMNTGPLASSVQEDILLDKEKKELLHRHLEVMPINYRDVVIAYYFHEKTYQQIAVEQQIEIKTVESKLYRARHWIRKNWKEEEFS
ncbi:MAG: sigma-70 family RNA polymerase sigma factor [Gorillibacterium sp.]|nr:sigma-70 family RNA polymerase sigma factor [Gorillibacterium sp.]